MNIIKKYYGWVIVAVLATLPLFVIGSMLELDFQHGLSIAGEEASSDGGRSTVDMLYHVSGEFAIRWMTAVLTLTPFFILTGIQNLFVRQAMGIATAVWSFLHFIIFIAAAGFAETFTQVNYVMGLVAVLILLPLFLTSNRKSMRKLKATWKKLQRWAYLAIILSLAHVALLDKAWAFYAVIVGLGFLIRVPAVRSAILRYRNQNVNQLSA